MGSQRCGPAFFRRGAPAKELPYRNLISVAGDALLRGCQLSQRLNRQIQNLQFRRMARHDSCIVGQIVGKRAECVGKMSQIGRCSGQRSRFRGFWWMVRSSFSRFYLLKSFVHLLLTDMAARQPFGHRGSPIELQAGLTRLAPDHFPAYRGFPTPKAHVLPHGRQRCAFDESTAGREISDLHRTGSRRAHHRRQYEHIRPHFSPSTVRVCDHV